MSNSSSGASRRVEALDAFRGIASFLIMVSHTILLVPQVCQVENMGAIYGGLSWKLPYFFVLSGFVLTLSYQRMKSGLEHPFRSFLISRVFRIYPLFIITTVVMFLLKVIFGAGVPIEGASTYFNISWQLSPSFVSLIHALTLVGLENTWLYNGPAWTLVFEMRYAILFPLILAPLRRSWLCVVLFVAMACVAAHVSSGLERVDIFYETNYVVAKICGMFSFLLIYAGGIVLALHREPLSKWYNALPRWGSVAVLVATVVAVLNPLWLKYFLAYGVVSSVVGSWVMLLGVMAWVIILLNNERIAAIFSSRWLVALGRSSFSIYMWHTPIGTLLFMLLHEHIDIWYIVALSILSTLCIAPLSFRYIESPVIEWSRRFRR